MKPKLIILVGISGCGKTRWVKSLDLINTVVVSMDEIRKETRGDINRQDWVEDIISEAKYRIAFYLSLGFDVIFDSTNLKFGDRRGLLSTLNEYTLVEFDAYAKVFEANPELSKQRIAEDIKNGLNRANVPDYRIDKQYAQYKAMIKFVESDGFKLIK